MFMSDPPYWLWSIWRELSILNRLFLLILFTVSIYCLWSSGNTLGRLRSIRRVELNKDPILISQTLLVLHNRCANMRHVIASTFYLFGAVLFLGLETQPPVVGDGAVQPMRIIVANFELLFAFAANVFMALFLLHAVSWFVSCRVNASSMNLRVNN